MFYFKRLFICYIVFTTISHQFIDLINADDSWIPSESHARAGHYSWDPNFECGLVNVTTKHRIIDGETAELGEFPWMSAMFITLRPPNPDYNPIPIYQCGAVVISDYFIMTAKNCIEDLVIPDVMYTDFYLGSKYTYETSVLHEMHSYYLNKEFNIALIRVKNRIRNEFIGDKYRINKVCLPLINIMNPKQEEAFLSSFGETDPIGKKRNWQLRKTKYNIESVDYCMEKYGINDYSICVETKKHITCKGDTGSPLVQFDGERAVLIGIVSYHGPNPDECGPGFVVFVRVSPFIDWIRNLIESDSGENITPKPKEPAPIQPVTSDVITNETSEGNSEAEPSPDPAQIGSNQTTSGNDCNRLTHKTISIVIEFVFIFYIFI